MIPKTTYTIAVALALGIGGCQFAQHRVASKMDAERSEMRKEIKSLEALERCKRRMRDNDFKNRNQRYFCREMIEIEGK